jgi:hypothetical protein
VSDIDTAVADSLKVLDLKRPIREAEMPARRDHRCGSPNADLADPIEDLHMEDDPNDLYAP